MRSLYWRTDQATVRRYRRSLRRHSRVRVVWGRQSSQTGCPLRTGPHSNDWVWCWPMARVVETPLVVAVGTGMGLGTGTGLAVPKMVVAAAVVLMEETRHCQRGRPNCFHWPWTDVVPPTASRAAWARTAPRFDLFCVPIHRHHSIRTTYTHVHDGLFNKKCTWELAKPGSYLGNGPVNTVIIPTISPLSLEKQREKAMASRTPSQTGTAAARTRSDLRRGSPACCWIDPLLAPLLMRMVTHWSNRT